MFHCSTNLHSCNCNWRLISIYHENQNKHFPSGLKTALFKGVLCFITGPICFPVNASQRRALLSQLAVNINFPLVLKTALVITLSCFRENICFPVTTFHRRAVLSQLAVNIVFVSGLKTALVTILCSCLKEFILFVVKGSVAKYQRRTVLSPPAVKSHFPSGLKATLLTSSLCFITGPICFPVGTSQRRAVESRLAVSINFPLRLKTALRTKSSCFRRYICLPAVKFHS